MTAGEGQIRRVDRGRGGRWVRGVVLLVLLMFVVVGAAWIWRLPLAEHLLHRLAMSRGVELMSVSVDRLDIRGAVVSNVVVGGPDAQRIDTVTVDWSLSGLLDRHVERIAISQARLQITVGPDGEIIVEGFPHFEDQGSGAGGLVFPEDFPASRVEVSQSEVSVVLPDGIATVSIDGRMETSGDALAAEASLRYTADTRRGKGEGSGAASISWPKDGAPRGAFDLEFDRLVATNLTATNLRITGGTERLPERLADISFRAGATADTIETSQAMVRGVTGAIDLSGGMLDARGTGEIHDLTVGISAQLDAFDLSRPATFSLSAIGDVAGVVARVPFAFAEGAIAVTVDGEIASPAALLAARETIARDPVRLSDHVTARATLETALDRFGRAGRIETGIVAAEISAIWDGEYLDLDIGDGARIDAIALSPDLTAQLAEWLPGATPFGVTINNGMGAPPTVRLRRSDAGIEARGIGGIDIALPAGTARLEIDGAATLTPAGGVDAFDIAAFSAVFDQLPTKFGTAAGDLLVTGLLGDGEEVNGLVSGTVSLGDASLPAVSAQQLTIELDGGVSASPDELSVELAPGNALSARDVQLDGGYGLPDTTRIELADGKHRLTWNRQSGELSANLRAKPGALQLALPNRTIDVAHTGGAVSGAWPGRLSLDVDGLSAGLDGGRWLEIADLAVRAEGDSSDVDIAFTADGAQPLLPGWTLPSFGATGEVMRRGNSLQGELGMTAAGGQPELRTRGSYDLDTGRGDVEILQAQLRFSPGVLQPGDLNPALSSAAGNVFAAISVEGTAAWERGGAITPEIVIKIEDMAGTSKNLELIDAETTASVTGLPNLATPPGQKFAGQVRVGRLEPTAFDILYQLLPGTSGAGPQLVIERLQAELTDGALTTDRFTITPPAIDTDLTVRVEGADLARAFELIGVTGVGGSGRIGGEIPLTVRGNRIAISGGKLTNDGPGTVFFDASALPASMMERGDTVTLVLQALSNFAYDELALDIDKTLDGPGIVKVRLAGANPDVLDNHPFIFNISLESDFDRLAALVLEGLTTSQGVLRALAVSGQRGASVP